MKKVKFVLIFFIMIILFLPGVAQSEPEYLLKAKFSDVIKRTAVKPVAAGNIVRVPLITWGGDVATILANGGKRTQGGSLFAQEGLNFELVRQDNFVEQVKEYLQGESPYLRGTLGMINIATAVLSTDQRTKPVVIYQMTWSTGGDAMVVKRDIKTPKDLRGKTIAIQQFGPHVDYLATILRDAGLSWNDVSIRWMKELTTPPYDTRGREVDPASAMRVDPSIDAAMVIIPDANALTSGGTVGTGAEDSVKGARILLSTKTANRVIADVYAVRPDYFQTHKEAVKSFVHGLLRGQEELDNLMKDKASQRTRYQQLLSQSADILLDSPQAGEEIEGLLADCTYVGFPGNVKFFGGRGEIRNFARLTTDIQQSYVQAGFLTRASSLAQAEWNYEELKHNLQNTEGVEISRFDIDKVERKLAQRAAQATTEEGVLFRFEIHFKPNQKDFPIDVYGADFQKAFELSSTYGGAVIEIAGNADPLKYLRAEKGGSSKPILERIKQSAKNLSLSRANSVRDSLIKYAQGRGITFDQSQFAVMGYGIEDPKYPRPKTEEQWRDNMRVVFKIINVEAELAEFEPF